MTNKYTPPVSQLLTYGDCRDCEEWPDYLALGFTEAHIPELIKMAEDENLLWAMSDTPEVWAPIHAWRTLGQLKAETAVPTLVKRLRLADENDDWAGEDIPSALAMIGPKAIPAVEAFINNKKNGISAKLAASELFIKLFERDPAYKQELKVAITRCLEKFRDNDPELNAVLISHAIDFKATEMLPLIQDAFEADRVDLMVSGDFEDVEIHMGIRKERSSPPPDLFQNSPSAKLRKAAAAIAQLSGGASSDKKKKKTGRNDPCPCGSGKKYKKCCLGKKI